LSVKNAWEGSKEIFKYVLYKNEKPAINDATFIKLPIKTAACLSSTHTAFLKNLDEANVVKAVSLDVYDSTFQNQVKSGAIKKIGDGATINYEMLIDVEPDVVFTFGVSDGSSVNKIKSLGLTPVIIAEFRESHPLAKAEWERFFGAFFDKEAIANQHFKTTSEAYLSIKELVQSQKNQPKVFTGVPFQGIWYVPSGSSTVGQYIADAGGDYLWKDKTGSMSLELDFEVVFDKSQEAEKWMDVGFVFSKKDVASKDKRFQQFKAFQTGEMYNYSKRVNENGIFDYYESGVIYPHLILRDFAKAFYPNLFENEDFEYYEQLK
jgi:iron complex transport system substrate-binding protein